jgi:hypothetical protein
VATIPDLDFTLVRKYCAERIPIEFHDRVRLEVIVRGATITIAECRPPWRADLGPDWTRHNVAQLRHESTEDQWTLYWADRNGRWHLFDHVGPGPIGKLLNEIELDSHGVFWG